MDFELMDVVKRSFYRENGQQTHAEIADYKNDA
jgi:hypothetical protein